MVVQNYQVRLIFYTEEDFSTHPIEMAILDHATYSGRYEFMVDITLNDDIVQEAAEYFLLVLSVQDSFSKEEIEIDQSRQCSGVKIKEDEDGKKLTKINTFPTPPPQPFLPTV